MRCWKGSDLLKKTQATYLDLYPMPQKRKYVRTVESDEIDTMMKKTRIDVTFAEMDRLLSFLLTPVDWSGSACSIFEGSTTHATHRSKLHRHLGWRGKTITAHRLFYHIFNGDPANHMVLHTCKSGGACVSPLHLAVGTARQNSDDRYRDGTIGVKLSIQDVQTIRVRAAKGEKHHLIAADYPVSRSMIQKIATQKNFKKI